MSRSRSGLGLLLALLCLAAAPNRQELGSHPLWDDGKAEVSLYDVEEPLYGTSRRFEARMIVVKEDLRLDTHVKSDRGPIPGETREVLKLNHIRLIPTGTYDYHQMLSAYLERDSLRPVKLSMAHFESCGITFVELLTGAGSLKQVSHSYWDGEADQDLSIPFAREDLLADALPLQLRGMAFSRTVPLAVNVLPSRIGGRVAKPALVPMTLTFKPAQRLEVPAGAFDAVEVVLQGPEGKGRFFFDSAFPYLLIKMETAAGGVYRLRKSLRLDYWNHHDPGDEKLLR
ncbi:MAG TPA: hypothetical protein VFW45_07215 [Candidatus Polarisedimenticolia bacterium]|nr:hypothetical protein [Candidatus Polarisedimenticolia bacterium]